MANALYTTFKAAQLAAAVNFPSDTIKCTLVDAADYTVNLSTHDFYNDVTVAGRVATSSALASKTTTNGTFDSADVTLSAVTGDQSEAVVLWKDTTVESTSTLIAYYDTGTGLPITPNGSDITITINASGWFSL